MLVSEKLNGYGPLNGVKVVELCEWVAAPATVRILSEMGAEIMKVEPLHGDAQRTQGPGFGCEQNDTEDPTIDLNNTNKNWIALNLKSEEGFEVMDKLLSEADVFVCNLRDKALVKLGLDYDALAAKYPSLIWAQLRGYGPRLRRCVLGCSWRRCQLLPRGWRVPCDPAAGFRRLQRRFHHGRRYPGCSVQPYPHRQGRQGHLQPVRRCHLGRQHRHHGHAVRCTVPEVA